MKTFKKMYQYSKNIYCNYKLKEADSNSNCSNITRAILVGGCGSGKTSFINHMC